uniref:C2H2-type domain-containing protein n=1 Tax=Xiphophorus couchianus TaxID=32473 RepID=A0A3B5KZP2_9TELE
MTRHRQCILCETVCASKQEMDEHMRSMLHHRELEKLKGRDCGHECRVCKVKVVSLTDYAGHISTDCPIYAARLAKEEEERKRKEEFQQRLNQLKERYRLERMWQAPPQGFGGPGHHRSWHRSSYYDDSREEARHWHQNQQWRSATWHAQEPPRLQKWATVEFSNNNSYPVNSNRTWGNGGQQSRLPWLSNGGSSNGLYGHNNIARYRDARLQHGEASLADSDYHSKNSKTLGSNPKLDKSCRWSPYPVASGSHVETHQNTSEKHQMASKPQRQPQCERAPVDSSLQNVEKDGSHPIKPTTQTQHVSDGSCSGIKGNGSQRDGDQNGASGFSGEQANKPPLQVDQKSSSVSGAKGASQHSKASSQSKPGGKQSGTKVPDGYLTSRQEKCSPESFRSVRQIGFERKGSLERTHHLGEQQNQGEPLKERSASESSGKATSPAAFRQEKAPSASAEDGTFVQSLHVSTSTTEGVESASAAKRDEENRNRAETQSPTAVQAEAMQVSEAGQSSESDAGRTGEAHATSGSDATALSKLDLPPVLKRDLTKHMNSKSKAAGHEPNLNIARRVRTLSESKRSDTEKDSSLKPTVRQLINSASARRSVNWEQVYQEVRKKQDNGKGMPRFGIEMVPYEQESQSQEEDGLPLIEGFQWESLMEITSESKSRKRSLSESSLTPAAPHSSVFGSSKSEETVEKEESGSTLPSASETQERQPEEEVKNQTDNLHCTTAKVLQRVDLTLGDSSSGAEQYDGTGKRRRAAGVGLSCLEHDSKRRKVKSKRERLQIDQLLAVSLREEELSQSLQNVDTNLIQARAALEAAFVEVQRLLVVKQQITVEMSSLRNKRIDLLKGMQGKKYAPEANPKEKHLDSFGAEPLESSSCIKYPPVPSTVVSSPNRAAECASPPSSSLPLDVVIKEEPQSPVCVTSEPDPDHNITNCAHSTTLDNTNPLGKTS